MDHSPSDPSGTPTGRTPRASINAKIAAHQARQEGQISFRQLTAAGLDSRAISRRVRNRLLVPRTEPTAASSPRSRQSLLGQRERQRARPSRVFSAHGGKLSPQARRWVAVLSAPEPSFLSHSSVFAAMGLERLTSEPIHVVHVGSGWDPVKGVTAHRTTALPLADRTTLNGLPSTRLARAFIDAADSIDQSRLDDLLDTAVRENVYDGNEMLRVLNDRPTLPGAITLTEAIGRLDALSGTFRSNFERRTTRLVETSRRISVPVVNVLVHGYRPDLWWRGTRAIVECDGRDYHRSPAQIAADEEREAILRARGYVILRIRWSQLAYEEAATLERIERFVLANSEPPMPR